VFGHFLLETNGGFHRLSFLALQKELRGLIHQIPANALSKVKCARQQPCCQSEKRSLQENKPVLDRMRFWFHWLLNQPKTPEPAPGSNVNSRMRVSKLDVKGHWK
jgi:hypothetical protein